MEQGGCQGCGQDYRVQAANTVSLSNTPSGPDHVARIGDPLILSPAIE